jgi:MYXO-CTERM domain-containing protein
MSVSAIALAEPTQLDTLERELDEENAALSTDLGASDCMAACRALTSMRRAAEKICALSPGPRCEAARAKASAASDRVKKSCPTCATTATEERQDKKEKQSPPASAPTEAAAPPPAERSKGGCASCTTGASPTSSDLGTAFAAALALSRLLRRKRRCR